MPIFQDEHGVAVKFFIQKDLPHEVQVELCENITALGGRVDSKVPRQGYLLVQPGSSEEERLRLCWMTRDRPDRHVVPYSYVEACKIAGQELMQIFVHEGKSMPMHIHPSIMNVNSRAALSARIMHSGGDPNVSEQNARVVLADPNTEIFQHLVKTYQNDPNKHVESYLWVKKCVDRNTLVFTPVVYKNPGGRRQGEERMQFTVEDEDNLCRWIAAKIPYKPSGGRTGNRVYQQLVEMAADPEYSWVGRHTWQSWRERYKKNAARLDQRIWDFVEEYKPTFGGKGQYGYVRQEEKPKRVRRKRKSATDAASDAEGDDVLVGYPSGSADGMRLIQENVYIPPPHMHMSMTPTPGMPMGMPMTPGMMAGSPMAMGPHAAPPHMMPQMHQMPDASETAESPRRPPEKEEVEDPDEAEWAVRIGDEPPPVWAKRSLEGEGDGANKRARHGEHPGAQLHITDVHVIDQAILQIANDFRFTVGEVQEYYDKCAEMERTRTRFQRMREELQRLFGHDDGSQPTS